MMIPPYLAAQGVRQALGRIEVRGRQHLAHPSVEALHPAVSLRMTRLDEAVFAPVVSADAITTMTPGRVALAGGATAIGNRLAVIGPHLLDLEGRLIDAPLAKFGGMVRRLCASDGHVNPAGGAVNGHEQIAMRGLVWQLRPLLDRGVNESRLIILTGFLRLLVVFWRGNQGLKMRDARPAQAAIQTRA